MQNLVKVRAPMRFMPDMEIINDLVNEATANFESWGVKKKRALELLIVKYVMYTKFGIDINLPDQSTEIFKLDHQYDGGCDHHWYMEADNHLILVQLKTNNFSAEGGDPWLPAYNMGQNEQTKIANIFAKQVKNGTHNEYLQNAGNGNLFQNLTARYLELHPIMNREDTNVTICNIVTGTFGGNAEQVKNDVEAEGFSYIGIDWDDIENAWREYVMMTNTGGIIPNITLKFKKSFCSFSSEIRGLSDMEIDDLRTVLNEKHITIPEGLESAELIELIENNCSRNILGFVSGKSIRDAVNQYGMSLTLGNLRHFVGFSSTGASSNDGMKGTLQDSPEKFHERNNGLRITCRGVTVLESEGDWVDVQLDSPQIVNGGQTSWVLAKFGTSPEALEILENHVKVLVFAIDVTDDPDNGQIIAKASNTQTALNKWAFHANSEVQRTLLHRMSNTFFEVCGVNKSFFYAIKEGEFERLSDNQKHTHYVPDVPNAKYQLTPQEVGKFILCMRMNSYAAYQRTPDFSKLQNEGNGLYEEIYVNNFPNIESLIYTRIIWESVINLNKKLKDLATQNQHQDMWSYAKEAVTSSFFAIMKSAHNIEETQDLYDQIRDNYFPDIDWEKEEGKGYKLSQMSDDKLLQLFGGENGIENTYNALYPILLAVHTNAGWVQGEASQKYFKDADFQNNFINAFSAHFINQNQLLQNNEVDFFGGIFSIPDDD